MRATILLIAGILSLSFHDEKTTFGLESISAYKNGKNIGRWVLFKKTIDTLKVDFTTELDTLIFYGFCDCGCLDFSALLVKDDRNNILTEISQKSALQRRDSFIQKADSLKRINSSEKISIPLENGIEFKITIKELKRLIKGKTYYLFLKRYGFYKNNDEEDDHIFYLQKI